MDALAETQADEAQPRYPGMGGFRHRTRHVEMKYRFSPDRALFRQSPPAGVAHPRRTVAEYAFAHEIDIGIVFVGRPMLLEILEERRPVRLEAMHLEIAQRK